jgi:hypothetical protein
VVGAARVKHLFKAKRKMAPVATIAEEFPFAAETIAAHFLSAPLTSVGAAGRDETVADARKRCGMTLTYKASYTVAEVVHYLAMCVAKSGAMQRSIDEDGEQRVAATYMALARTAAHQLAALGADYLLRRLITKYPGLIEATDNMGRTPLHYAAAHQHASTMALLVKAGASMAAKEAGNMTPIEMACTTPSMRKAFEEVAPPGICKGVAQGAEGRLFEEEDDDCDLSGGGWADADGAASQQSSPFDARTGDALSHFDLMGRYTLSSRPVILRAVPAKMQKLLRKSPFLRRHGDVWVRREVYPRAEHYGTAAESFNTTIRDFLMNTDDRFGVVEVSKRHPLYDTLNYMPDALLPKSGFTTVSDTVPLLIIAGAGARTNHVAAGDHIAHSVLHGRQTFLLSPPPTARTTRARAMWNVTDETVQRVTLQAGDMLVIPMLWSAAFASETSESVAVQRRFLWK